MKTILRTDLTVEDISRGFTYNEYEGKGLYGWSGKLTIQPEYQRNYIYNDGKNDVHINAQKTVGCPYFGELVLDSINRTENAMTQEHAFKAAELCLKAQMASDAMA